MANPEAVNVQKSPLEKAKERYASAVQSVARAGAMKFVELVEQQNPIAKEYIDALNELHSLSMEDVGGVEIGS